MTRTGRVQAIDRAVMILNCFTNDRKELKLSDISDMLDLNKSTAHGIISTLRYHGLIDQDEDTQKYRLGLYLMTLGERVSNSLDIIEISNPIIKELCTKVDETVHLGTLDNMEVVYLDKTESHQSMRIVTTIGARIPAYCTGIGKAMLAYQDMEVLMEKLPENLKQYTPKTIPNRKALLEQLDEIRNVGYALDDEEHNIGLKCIAAPVFDYNGQAKYAISVSGPTVRMTDEKVQETIDIVLNIANEISNKLGYK